MDPLPSVNKAYSMVLRVEKQREVHVIFPEINDNSAMLVKTVEYRRDSGGRNGYYRGSGRGCFGGGSYNSARGNTRRFGAIEKEHSHFDHCNMNPHTKDICFKLNGYPDWYRDLKEQRSRSSTDGKYLANMAEIPLDFNEDQMNEVMKNDMSASTNIADIVKLEVQRALRGKMLMDLENKVNFTHIKEYAGPAE